MNASPNLHIPNMTDQRLIAAFTKGLAETYLKAYVEVMTLLEAERATHLLAQVVTRLRGVMAEQKLDVYAAGQVLMSDLESQRSKLFVMAAMVDEALMGHTRTPGKPVVAVLGMREVLGG